MIVYDWRDHYEERAAIREYDGGFNRHQAEVLAYLECQQAYMRQEDCDKNHAIIELTKMDILNPGRKK